MSWGFAPAEIVALFDRLKVGYPDAVNGGIVGSDYGYHICRNAAAGDDYSVQRADDQLGDPGASSGLDVTMHAPADMARMTQRLIDLTMAGDPRVQALREFFGTVDGANVTGLDVRDKRWISSDPSHLWHVHISIYRKFSQDNAALQAVADAILGTGSINEGDDMPSVDEMKQAMRDVLNEGTPQGQTGWAGSFKNYVYQAAHSIQTAVPYGQTNWRQSYIELYNRVGQIITQLNKLSEAAGIEPMAVADDEPADESTPDEPLPDL